MLLSDHVGIARKGNPQDGKCDPLLLLPDIVSLALNKQIPQMSVDMSPDNRDIFGNGLRNDNLKNLLKGRLVLRRGPNEQLYQLFGDIF